MSWWERLLRRKKVEQDLDRELQFHVAERISALESAGLSEGEARRRVRQEFGGLEQVREQCREARDTRWLEDFCQDTRIAARTLRKTPGFTLAVAFTVALGIAANTGVFSLIDAVLLRALPVAKPNQLIFLETAGSAGLSGPPPYPCFVRIRAETNAFSGAAAFASDELRIEINGTPEQVMGQVASGNYFDVLGVRPESGRLMNVQDEKLNAPVAVISDRFWRRRFGADPAAVGKSISYRGRPFTIIGITPPAFLGLQPGSPVDLTLPISIERELEADAGAFWLEGIIARLRPGVSAMKAAAESDVVFRSFMSASRYGSAGDLVAEHWAHLEVIPAAHGTDVLRRRFASPLDALMSVALLVLLLAIANVANLLLARGFTRSGEFGIRLAIGAGRLRLVRQLLTETVLLFTLGAIPGAAIASWGVRFVQMLFREGRRAIAVDASLSWRTLIFCLIATLCAALLSGIIPAWRAIGIDPEQTIKEGQTRISESRSGAKLAQALVAFQVALSFVLLVGAVVFVRSLVNLRHIDPGFRNQDVLTLSIQLPEKTARSAGSAAVWNRVLESVRTIPGVRTAALATFTPLSGRDRGAVVKVRGYNPPTSDDGIIHTDQVSDGYFESLGIRLLRGRLLTDGDTQGTTKVAVINESAARKYFDDRNPIGQSLEFVRNGERSFYQIVGIVADTKHMSLREASPRFAFIPIWQPRDQEQRLTLLVAPAQSGRGLALVEPIRRELTALNPQLLISDVITMRRQLDSTLITERLLSELGGAFGTLAVIIAAVGLYALLSYQIGQQHRSIGIRMALGAAPSSVSLALFRQTALLVSIGLLVGLPFAFWGTQFAGAMLWGVDARDAWIYFGSAALLTVICMISAYVPARRASAIEPLVALRHG